MPQVLKGPVTIREAHTQHGWSGNDHQIDDTRISALVGRRFSTYAQATRALDAAADRLGYASALLETEAVQYDAVTPAGALFRYDGSADLKIPGRDVPRFRLETRP